MNAEIVFSFNTWPYLHILADSKTVTLWFLQSIREVEEETKPLNFNLSWSYQR